MTVEKFISVRDEVAVEVDLERFLPVLNEDGTLDIHPKALPDRWIRMLLLGGTAVFALMKEGTGDWTGRGSHREEDIPELLEDAIRRIAWN